MTDISNEELDRQYQLNVRFNLSLHDVEELTNLIELGVPFSSSELFNYGASKYGFPHENNYRCNTISNASEKCLVYEYYPSLELLIDSPQWTLQASQRLLYDAIDRGIPLFRFKKLFDRIVTNQPDFLTTDRAVSLFYCVAKSKKFLGIEDIKEVIGGIPLATPLVYWACQHLPDTEKLETAIEFYKNMFGQDYKKEIVNGIDTFVKSFPILNTEVLTYLDDLYQDNGGNQLKFRLLAFKEIAKKYRTYHKQNRNVDSLIQEHLGILLPVPKMNKTVLQFVENKPELSPLVHTIADYVRFNNLLSKKNHNKKHVSKI